MNGPFATILTDQQRKDLLDALETAVDDLTERVIPNRYNEYDPDDVRHAEAKSRRFVDLINFLSPEAHR